MDREVIIKTYPAPQGDLEYRTKLSVLTPEKIFKMPYTVVCGGVQVRTWDDLLKEVNKLPDNAPVNITRFTQEIETG